MAGVFGAMMRDPVEVAKPELAKMRGEPVGALLELRGRCSRRAPWMTAVRSGKTYALRPQERDRRQLRAIGLPLLVHLHQPS